LMKTNPHRRKPVRVFFVCRVPLATGYFNPAGGSTPE